MSGSTPSNEDVRIFCLAAANGDIGGVRMMLEIYGDDIINQKGSSIMCALSWAARSGEIEVMGVLLDNGAPIDEGTYYRGCTPLAWAAYMGEEEAVKFLLCRGADSSKKNNEGQTPADIARKYDYAEIADVIEQWAVKQEAEKRVRSARQPKDLTETHIEILRAKRPPVPSLIKQKFPKP